MALGRRPEPDGNNIIPLPPLAAASVVTQLTSPRHVCQLPAAGTREGTWSPEGAGLLIRWETEQRLKGSGHEGARFPGTRPQKQVTGTKAEHMEVQGGGRAHSASAYLATSHLLEGRTTRR